MPEEQVVDALDAKELTAVSYRRKSGPCSRVPKSWGEGCRVLLVLRRHGKVEKRDDVRIRVPDAAVRVRLRRRIGRLSVIRGRSSVEKLCKGYGQSPMAWIPVSWGDGCRVVALLLEKGDPIPQRRHT